MAEKRILTEDELDCVTGGAKVLVGAQEAKWVAKGDGAVAEVMQNRVESKNILVPANGALRRAGGCYRRADDCSPDSKYGR